MERRFYFLYSVGHKLSQRFTNKDKLLKLARQSGHVGKIISVSRSYFREGGKFGYDVPTLLASAKFEQNV